MTRQEQRILALVKQEVVPAMGCTEPMAVALCVAKATEVLGTTPKRIEVLLSPNILKNAMGVGIPGTGMIGLPIAIVLGALIGRADYQLEVLKDVTPSDVEKAKKYLSENRVHITLAPKTCDKLYIQARCDTVKVVIEHTHTHISCIERDGEVLMSNPIVQEGGCEQDVELCMQQVYDFAMNTPLQDIAFIKEAAELNGRAAQESLKGTYGHCLGRVLQTTDAHNLMGDTLFNHILSYTSAACDARMAGLPITVMSNSGSGNQGISATVPVLVYARETGKSEEQLIRALMLSHLTAIYIKQSLGRLSALCGCVVAGIGSACGMCYLMGGDYNAICATIKNMVANITGMICDGAKPSCALKVTSGISTAILSALLAIEHQTTGQLEGIVSDDVDKCIHNMTRIGTEGMERTDEVILNIMLNK